MSGLLGDLTVAFRIDLSNVASGIIQTKDMMSSLAQSVTSATSVFKTLEGSANAGKIISNVATVEEQLALIETNVNEARATLQTLQNAANAGEAVTGIPEAEANLASLENQAQQARTSLADLQSGESQLSTQSQETAASTSLLSSGLSGIASSVMNFGQQLGMTVMGLQGLGQMAQQVAGSLLQPAMTAETTQLSFTTLLHSTSAAKDMMQSLNTFASGTPMQTQWVDDAAAKILAFGGKVGDIKPEITAIGDSLSGLGKLSSASLNSIVDVFGKISAQGKITGGDMMQLSDWGIPAWQALSTSMHKPIPELQDMVSKGLIPASLALPALETGMEKTFGGSMDKQAHTMSGTISTLTSNFQIAIATMGSPVLKALEPEMSKLADTLSSPSFQHFATVIGTDIGGAFTKLMGAMAPVGQFFIGIANNWRDVIGSINFGPLIQAAQNLFNTISSSSAPALFMVLLNNISNLAASLVGPLVNLATAGIGYVTERMKAMQPVAVALITGVSGIALALQNFLPPLIDIATNLLNWYTSSGLANAGMGLLSGTITVLSTIISTLLTDLGQLFSLFTQNTASGQILRDILIGVGVAIASIQIATLVGTLLTALPEIIAGFALWASEATVTAIATIAAAAPIYLIGAAIALVVAGIILAVQHWGDISKWLQGAWSNVASFFAGIWKDIQNVFGGIGQWFTDRFHEAATGVQNGFQGAKDFFSGIGDWFKDRGTQAAAGTKTGLKAASDGYMDMAHKFGEAGQWLYDHNYYVKATVDLIVGWVQATVTWLQTTWTNVTAGIATEWLALSTAATLYFGMITTAISQKVQEVQNFVMSIWTAVTGWLSAQWQIISIAANLYWGIISTYVSQRLQEAQAFIMSIWTAAAGWLGAQWNLLAGMANAAWQAVSAVFASIWSTYISGPLGDLWNQITGWFNNLGNQAHTSGQNFISMLVSGIQSGAGSVWNAVVGIANQIWAALGFHSPAKAGPGADADKWMPNLVNMLSSSLIAQQPKMSLAVQTIAQPLAMMNAGSYPAHYGGSSAPLQGSSAATSTGDQHFHIYLGDEEIAHKIGNAQMRYTRLRTGMKL